MKQSFTKTPFSPQLPNYVTALRLGLGWVFAWAFFDKLFGLGFATCRDAATNVINYGCDAAWLSGGSPTRGFLTFGTSGPFAESFSSIAGATWADWLFMLGLLLIGMSLILGVGIRIAIYSGSLLMLLMWLAALPPPNNPAIDDHLIYIVALFVVGATIDMQRLSLSNWWAKQPIVKKLPILR